MDETILSWSLIVCYLSYTTYFEKYDFKEVKNSIKNNFLRIWMTDLSVWPII